MTFFGVNVNPFSSAVGQKIGEFDHSLTNIVITDECL